LVQAAVWRIIEAGFHNPEYTAAPNEHEVGLLIEGVEPNAPVVGVDINPG